MTGSKNASMTAKDIIIKIEYYKNIDSVIRVFSMIFCFLKNGQ